LHIRNNRGRFAGAGLFSEMDHSSFYAGNIAVDRFIFNEWMV
jgi:hypothetical protein